MKRIISLLICLSLMLSQAAVMVSAEETEFYKVRISAGEGYCVEKAILEKDELYIPAESFERYTCYRFDSEMNIFLLDGQELNKAFKIVKIDPVEKQVSVGSYRMSLKNCYMVDGKLYLPFCQMLPILNATIVSASERTIEVANEPFTMAHLMYNFNVNDYFFDLNKEFYDNEWLLIGYFLPSYLFDSVTDFRLDRLDFFFNSGTFEDYREILSGYLKDDDLFERAFKQIDDPETLLRLVTGINKETKKVYDVVDWYRKMEELAKDTKSVLNEDTLVQFIGGGSSKKLPYYEADITDVILGVHEESNGISFADAYEMMYYVYTCYSKVEDNHKMLDVVYDISGGNDSWDAQYRAAREVYDLYGDNVVLALTERIGKEGLKEWIKGKAAIKKFAAYELTAKAAGAAWELVIPGDTGDVSVLTLHAGVADTARMSAVACDLHTEASVEDYRLSLLLMMLASRECYKIMADTAEAHDGISGDYRAKIEKIENMIQGLYLVAKNQPLDACENFEPYARQNREFMKEAGFFRNPEPVEPGEMVGPEESAYFEFLAEHPQYRYYALVDINLDGCDELLVMDDAPFGVMDIWIWNGGFIQARKDILVNMTPPSFSSNCRWIKKDILGKGGGGSEYFYLDENLTMQSFTVEYYDWCGYLYNGEELSEEEMEVIWEMIAERGTDNGEEIEFLPVSAPAEEEPPQDEYLNFLSQHPQYRYYARLDINRDGCDELLATEIGIPDEQKVDLWLYRDGKFVLGYENIQVYHIGLRYSSIECWVENVITGAMGGGAEFFYLDGSGNLVRESFEHYEWCGGLYNGEPAEDWEDYMAYERLEEAYDPEKSVEIEFIPVP